MVSAANPYIADNLMKDSLIIKYFEGTLGEKETAELRTWLEEKEENMDYFLSLEEAYLSMASTKDMEAADTDAAWSRFMSKFGSARRIRAHKAFIRIAGLAAMAACVFFIGRKTAGVTEHVTQFDGTTVIQTSMGQQSKMTLPDGTTVLLNDCSKLTYNPLEWKTERKVKLEGQASFNVVHMDNLPFKVASNLYEVAVLGTEFNISCYAEDKFSTVSLKHGKVEVDFLQPLEAASLKPGETLTYDIESQKYTIEHLSEEVAYSWENKIIVFDNNSLLDKANELHRHYGYVFDISKDCAGFTYNGSFKGETIREFMDIFATITPNLKYSIDGVSHTVKIWI